MARSSPTKSEECEVRWIQAALHGQCPHGHCHLEIRDFDDSGSGRRSVEAERGAHLALDRLSSRFGVELDPARDEPRRRDAAQDGVRVRDRGSTAAPAVADRTRTGAGTLWANIQGPDLVDPSERAAACPD